MRGLCLTDGVIFLSRKFECCMDEDGKENEVRIQFCLSKYVDSYNSHLRLDCRHRFFEHPFTIDLPVRVQKTSAFQLLFDDEKGPNEVRIESV